MVAKMWTAVTTVTDGRQRRGPQSTREAVTQGPCVPMSVSLREGKASTSEGQQLLRQPGGLHFRRRWSPEVSKKHQKADIGKHAMYINQHWL